MTVASCPKCREEVTLPAGASSSARVRCPLCYEEYTLSEALESLPPRLVVLDDPRAGESGIGFAGVSGAADEAAAGDERAPAFEFEEHSAPAATAKISATPRPKKKPKSMVLELAKIVGGGVIGLSAGLMLTIWFLGDPLKFGPKIGSMLPWAVPAKYRPDNDTNGDPAKDEKPGDENNTSAGGNSNSNGGNSQNFGPEFESGPFDLGPDLTDGNGHGVGAAGTPGGGSNTLATDSGLPQTDFNTEGTETAPGVFDEPLVAEAQPHPWLKNAKTSSASDLAGAIEGVSNAHLAWRSVDKADKNAQRDVGTQLHESLAILGDVVARLDTDDPNLTPEVARLQSTMAAIGSDKELGRIVTTLALGKLIADERSDNGMVFAGEVIEVTQHGELYEILLKPDAPQRVLTQFPQLGKISVYGWMPPPPQCKAGAEAVVLGLILDKPIENLKDYSGDAEELICGGFIHLRKAEGESPPANDTPVEVPAIDLPPIELPSIELPSVETPPASGENE